jgi:hypothetical protein
MENSSQDDDEINSMRSLDFQTNQEEDQNFPDVNMACFSAPIKQPEEFTGDGGSSIFSSQAGHADFLTSFN